MQTTIRTRNRVCVALCLREWPTTDLSILSVVMEGLREIYADGEEFE